jgi:hypothetical protein
MDDSIDKLAREIEQTIIQNKQYLDECPVFDPPPGEGSRARQSTDVSSDVVRVHEI